MYNLLVKTYQFSGEIYPSGVLNIKDFKLDADDVGGYDNPFNGNLTLLIHDDSVIIKFVTDQDFDSDLDTLRKSLEYFSKIVIDSTNYCFGTAVELYLTWGGNTSKELYTFPPKVNSLFEEKSRRPVEPLELIKLAASNIQLRRALEQAKDAINRPMDAGLHCYRAIEAIRRAFLIGDADEGTPKKRSWEDMNSSLKLTQEFYVLIKEHADVARHGGVKSASSREMEEMLHKTWDIIDRYILYLKGGKVSLGDSYEVLN